MTNGTYSHLERVYREGWQARASTEELKLRVGGVEANLLQKEDGQRVITNYKNGDRLELSFRPLKPLVVFGNRGLSRKGESPGAVSWYWSYTRLQATGILFQKNKEIPVNGIAWMDHEISSSQLGEGLEGWDWTCMQLDDGTEVKAYRLREMDGDSDPWSAVYWIDRDGKTESVYSADFLWEEKDTWTSQKTGLKYPTTVQIIANHPNLGKKTYFIRPLLEPQEFTCNREDNAYWEGECEVLNIKGERIGSAYLELAWIWGGVKCPSELKVILFSGFPGIAIQCPGKVQIWIVTRFLEHENVRE